MATVGEVITYEISKIEWSQSKLAVCARIPQSKINKIINGYFNNIYVDELISICLVLRLNKKKAVDLLARASRAISPADPCHDTYYELIEIYSKKKLPVTEEEICNFLFEADEILKKRKLPSLPSDVW